MEYINGALGWPLIALLIGIIGGLASNFYLPLRLKRREWKYEREVWAREFVFENISLMAFLANEYQKGQQDDEFSVSNFSLPETSKKMHEAFSLLCSGAYKVEAYADDKTLLYFKEFLRAVLSEYSAAKETWGLWYPDDVIEEQLHTEHTIHAVGGIASEFVKRFKGIYRPGWLHRFFTD